MFTDVYLEVSGGIPSSIYAQKEELKKRGHEVVVVCPGWENSRHDEDTIVVPTCRHLRFGGAPLAHRPTMVEAWLEQNHPELKDYDIFHVHYEAGCSIAAVRLAQKWQIPLVQTMHGREDMAIAMNIPHPIKTFIGWSLDVMHSWFLPHEVVVRRDKKLAPTVARAKMWTMMVNHANQADLVVTPSQHFADKLKYYGVKKPQAIISNGIPDAEMAQIDKKVRKWDGKKPLKIIWNSRVSREKRIIPFLEALCMIPEKNFEVNIYGDGNEYQRAVEFVRAHELDACVKFCGKVPREEILQRVHENQLSVMASYGFDNQSMILLEAVAAGLPVLYCDPDMSEVVPRNGAMLTAGPSPAEMAAGLQEILDNPKKIERMSAAMISYRDKVAQSVQVDKLLKFYENLVK